MARLAYIDCFSGVSGDMFLGALLDGGLPLEELRRELAKLPLTGWALEARAVKRGGLAATKADVRVQGCQGPWTLPQLVAIVEGSGLLQADREKGVAAFRRLAEAEAKVHGESVEEVRLHDVGALDTVIDIMGAVVGLRLLRVEAVYAAPLPMGEGEVEVEGVTLPVPAPATLEILARAGAPMLPGGQGEMVTPTGASILTAIARFERPAMTIQHVGYGAGSRDPQDRPNVLRLWLGEPLEGPGRTMVLIETNIDDMPGELLGYVQERLLAAGAADAWFTSIQMKKGRPAVMLSVLCSEAVEAELARLILRETSTLGVRVRPVHRYEAEREVMAFQPSLGPAAVKVKRLSGEPPLAAPEYEACKRLAEASGLPLAEVYRIVQAEAGGRLAE
jgi:uncharacterized protein (TIGR00299 family) protein